METQYTIVDRAALALSGALMLLGIVVLGIVEILAGQPYGAAPLTNDAGEVVATPFVDPNIRVGLVVLGLVVLFAWSVYRMVGSEFEETDHREADVVAD
jgi:hypothetical protein